MKLKEYLGSEYTFTPYIPEIAVMLKDPLQTLILCNLLNKLPDFNKEAKTMQVYGKSYNLKRNQSSIFGKELGVPKTTFEDNLKLLSDYVSYFGGTDNNGSGYPTTFYLLNVEAIKKLFNEGKKLLGKNTKVVQPEGKAYKKPYQSSKNSSLANIDNDLNRINELQAKRDRNEIDKNEFNYYFQPLKMKLGENNVSIKLNKNTNLWEKN